MPAGAKSCGVTVASADGETKLPVILTMVCDLASRNSRTPSLFFLFLFPVERTKEKKKPANRREKGNEAERGEEID